MRPLYSDNVSTHDVCDASHYVSMSSQANSYPSPRHAMTQCPVPSHQPHPSNATVNGAITHRIPPQRVQSQTLYDRKQKPVEPTPAPSNRPSTAQGYHNDQGNGDKTSLASPPSLSHIETCV